MPLNNINLGQNETNLGEVGLFRKNGKKREKMEMGKIWMAAAVRRHWALVWWVCGEVWVVGGGGLRCWARVWAERKQRWGKILFGEEK